MKTSHIIPTILFIFVTLAVQAVPRTIEISGKTEKFTKFEIVLEQNTPLLNFAATELQTLLKQATGLKAGIVKKQTPGMLSLILGDSSASRAAGLQTKNLPSEGYYIRRKGKQIYLVGKDDPKAAPKHNSWMQLYQRGTLSAVYDFLERFAGIRFFFPGKYGTVVPFRGGLLLPEKINILERPDMHDRRFYSGRPRWYEAQSSYNGVKGENLELLRLRYSESVVPFGHGLSYLKHIERFKKDHPEYFAMLPDGTRYYDRNMIHTGQYCFNSGIKEEIYQDAKAYLSGKPAASRGLKYWNWNCGGNGYFSAMPPDWLYWCACPACRKIATPGRTTSYTDLQQRQAISDFMWKFTADLAERLTKENVKGGIAQMAYMPYDKIPNVKIPQNVLVQVSINGAGTDTAQDRQETEFLKKWQKKLNNKVTVWTGALGKNMDKVLPGIPAMMPEHLARFIEKNRELIYGGFFESETDYFLFNYLNYYVLAKKLWNNSLDTEKLLSDHYQTMFGQGAPMLREFFKSLEQNWVEKITGNITMTGQGPRAQIPGDFEIWTKIYSPGTLKKYNQLFNDAEKAAKKDKDSLARIRFIRKNMLGPLEEQAALFLKNQSILKSWIITCPGKVYLRPCRGEVNEVNTSVQVSKDAKNLIFRFECEEPRLKDMQAKETKRDAAKTYTDSSVELLLNPSGDRKTYYHFIVNCNGVLTDYKRVAGEKSDISWNSSAKVQTTKNKNAWTAVITIPLRELGTLNMSGFALNFCRNRMLNGKRSAVENYHWSPSPVSRKGYHALETWGTLIFKKQPEPVISNGNFTQRINYRNFTHLPDKWASWMSGGAKGGQIQKLDDKIFISGGQSFYFKNTAGKRMSSFTKLNKLQPNKKYRLSYFLRTKNLTGRKGAGALLILDGKKAKEYPNRQISGTRPWHRLSFEFTTPPDYNAGKARVGIWIWDAAGEAWFDDIQIEEILK